MFKQHKHRHDGCYSLCIDSAAQGSAHLPIVRPPCDRDAAISQKHFDRLVTKHIPYLSLHSLNSP